MKNSFSNAGKWNRKEMVKLASSELFLIVLLSFLRTVHEGSSAPLPHLRMTNTFFPWVEGFWLHVGKTCIFRSVPTLCCEIKFARNTCSRNRFLAKLWVKFCGRTLVYLLESERVCETSVLWDECGSSHDQGKHERDTFYQRMGGQLLCSLSEASASIA